jgi:hypothetical protein
MYNIVPYLKQNIPTAVSHFLILDGDVDFPKEGSVVVIPASSHYTHAKPNTGFSAMSVIHLIYSNIILLQHANINIVVFKLVKCIYSLIT